jgi:hypothetical protein
MKIQIIIFIFSLFFTYSNLIKSEGLEYKFMEDYKSLKTNNDLINRKFSPINEISFLEKDSNIINISKIYSF